MSKRAGRGLKPIAYMRMPTTSLVTCPRCGIDVHIIVHSRADSESEAETPCRCYSCHGCRQSVVIHVNGNNGNVRAVAEVRTLYDVSPSTWVSRRKAIPISSLHSVHLSRIIGTFIAKARAKASLDQTILERLVEISKEVPQLRYLMAEAYHRNVTQEHGLTHDYTVAGLTEPLYQKYIAALVEAELVRK